MYHGSNLVWKGRYKRRLQYLESTGTQWIDTGIVPENGMVFRIDAQKTVNQTSVYFGTEQGKFSAWNIGDGTVLGLDQFSNPQSSVWIFGYSEIGGMGELDRLSFVVDTDGMTATCSNGSETRTKQVNGSITSEQSLVIGNKNGKNEPFKGRLYSFAIDGIIDLIPVLDWNDRPAMFDRIGGDFFYNSGTGEYIY